MSNFLYWAILINNFLLFCWLFRKYHEVIESQTMLVEKISELGARQIILESRMGYEVTSFEISKTFKH